MYKYTKSRHAHIHYIHSTRGNIIDSRMTAEQFDWTVSNGLIRMLSPSIGLHEDKSGAHEMCLARTSRMLICGRHTWYDRNGMPLVCADFPIDPSHSHSHRNRYALAVHLNDLCRGRPTWLKWKPFPMAVPAESNGNFLIISAVSFMRMHVRGVCVMSWPMAWNRSSILAPAPKRKEILRFSNG